MPKPPIHVKYIFHHQPRKQIAMTHLLRRTLRKQRLALSTKDRNHRAFLASHHLHKLHALLPKNAKIGLYLDGFGELPVAPLIAFCLRHGHQVFLPITCIGKALTFAPICAQMHKTPLKKHRLGMFEPLTKPHLSADKLDMIICPLVAIDKQGNRMGMGGGFYDRTFAYAPQVLKVGYCYDFQVVETLKVNPWDKKVAMVITDKRILRFKKT